MQVREPVDGEDEIGVAGEELVADGESRHGAPDEEGVGVADDDLVGEAEHDLAGEEWVRAARERDPLSGAAPEDEFDGRSGSLEAWPESVSHVDQEVYKEKKRGRSVRSDKRQ